MDEFKEFQGKSLDDAIREACRHFDTEREKLEIDILNDAKSGIFGLVGARKARIRARRMSFDQPVADKRGRSTGFMSREDSQSRKDESARKERDTRDTAGKQTDKKPRQDSAPAKAEKDAEQAQPENAARPETEEGQESRPRSSRSRRGSRGRKEQGASGGAPKAGNVRKGPVSGSGEAEEAAAGAAFAAAAPQAEETAEQSAAEPAEKDENGRSRSRRRRPRPRRKSGSRGDDASRGQDENAAPDAAPEDLLPEGLQNDDFDDSQNGDEDNGDSAGNVNLADLDQEKVLSLVQTTVEKLILPVIGEVQLAARIDDNRVKVSVDCGDNSGLLIGREGQTLASFQYLVNRIVAKELGTPVRIQLDTGDYRERQDDKLRDLALHLADRAKTLGKPQSTRPLSSYHRRIVHLALQEDGEIQTRSKGEGPMKRVVILRRRKG
ncbi:RNA-binding cell elongation regulator Jag/EloR [Oleidesulfovibrio alaskensis]